MVARLFGLAGLDQCCGVILANGEIARVQALARSEDSNQTALEATEAGYDVMVLANDHIMDYSDGGLEDTIRLLGDSEIKTTGAGNNIAESLQPAVVLLLQRDFN